MRLYYFTKASHALSNVQKRRIKISRLDSLNDPFEWMAPALKKSIDRNALSRMKEEMGRRSGIVCFSERWKDPVQWSHYADHHRGICLGFDVTDSLATKVNYRRYRSKIDNLEQFQAEGKMTQQWLKDEVLCTKFSNWKYEREWRAFVQLDQTTAENGLFFLNFSQDMLLREAIVGHHCMVSRRELDEALGDLKSQVNSFKARLAFQTFGICKQRRNEMWRAN